MQSHLHGGTNNTVCVRCVCARVVCVRALCVCAHVAESRGQKEPQQLFNGVERVENVCVTIDQCGLALHYITG
jgi:hypothetical protein